MSFVSITQSEKVKISFMDEQHEEMTHIINKIYAAFILKNNPIVHINLDNLLKLLRVHFDSEEKLMKETNFGGYYSHKLEHDRFYQKVSTIITSYSANKPILTLDELNNFKNWFHNHIEISDKKCGAYFVTKGIK